MMKPAFGKTSAAVLAGAALLSVPAALQAQAGPIYFTPKVMYSHQTTDGFGASEYFDGFVLNSGRYDGSSESDGSWGGGLAVGYDFGATGGLPVRTELEYLLRSRTEPAYPAKRTGGLDGNNYVDSRYEAQATVQTVFANFYYDFRNDSAFTPYIGAGLGGANVKGELKSWHTGRLQHAGGAQYNVNNNFDGSNESWNFAWNVSAGAAYSLTDNVALDLSYRYSDMGKIEYGTHGYRLYNPADPDTTIGYYGGKAEADLAAHEVILGVRISAF